MSLASSSPEPVSTNIGAPNLLGVLPMSLAISPNLQALLEYDDRIREARTLSRPGTPASQISLNSQGPSVEHVFPLVGLPPPRRNRRNGSQPSSRSPSLSRTRTPPVERMMTFAIPPGHEEFEDDVEESKNPYINPPPVFAPSRTPSPIIFAKEWDEEPVLPSHDLGNLKSDEETRPTVYRSFSDDPREHRSGARPLHRRYLSRMEQVLGRKLPSVSSTEHARSRSGSTTRSEISESTHDPSSSPEPHISISSSRFSGSANSLSMTTSPDNDMFIDISRPYHDDAEVISLTSDLHPANPSPKSSTSFQQYRASSPSQKPPVPTTPKPRFNRPPSVQAARAFRTLPRVPTSGNNLSALERADLIRKNRKLTQLFGQTPQAQDISGDSSPSPSPDARKGFHRIAVSVSHGIALGEGPWTPDGDMGYTSINSRRHSTPLTPQELSFVSGSGAPDKAERASVLSRESSRRKGAGSPHSFIDLSDEDSGGETPREPDGRHRQPPFSKMQTDPSLESLTLEEQAEVERKRKRQKLAKLHRFLGSRVPPELALGFNSMLPPLPPVAVDDEDERHRFGLRRRRSNSPEDYVPTYVDLSDRLRSDLDTEEKAVNVRRAAKMEKVFGIAPPQTLYHTRTVSALPQIPVSKSAHNSPSTPDAPTPIVANYIIDRKGKKTRRPGTAESGQQLLPKLFGDDEDEGAEPRGSTEVYNSYRESLNSLSDIVARRDRNSLELLHEIMHGDPDDNVTPLQAFARQEEVSSRSERRRSLPSQPSLTSLSSFNSITSPPEISAFEQKRRRAAKLTNFFGVNHRDIMTDILESIEKGVEEEGSTGTLDPDQVQDLLQKLRKLKNET